MGIGLMGTLFFLLGLGIVIFLIISKIVDPSRYVSNRPPFYISLTAMVIGSQLFLAGFLGELIARNSITRNNYLIETKAGFD